MTAGVLRNAYRQLAEGWDVLAPVRCAGCTAPGNQLCPLCKRLLHGRHPSSTTLSGISLRVTYSSSFEGVTGRVITQFKDHGRLSLARDLAPLLARAYDTAAQECGAELRAVPVPTAPRSTRHRGYSHLEVLMRRARLPAHIVLRARDRADQSGLRRADRQRNVHNTMHCDDDLSDQNVIILDDVLTSGATIREAVRAVRAAGGNVVAAAVCARTPLRASESAVKSARES